MQFSDFFRKGAREYFSVSLHVISKNFEVGLNYDLYEHCLYDTKTEEFMRPEWVNEEV